MKCLVTGAGGFVGSALGRQLLIRGHSLVALVRDRTFTGGAQRVIHLDLGRESVPAELLADIETVYHCAGIAHQSASASDYLRVNQRATVDLATAAVAAGVKRFIFLSSVKAGETAGPYGYSKWCAEQALENEFVDSAMSIVSLRPALVYGAAVSGNLRSLITAVRRHMPAPMEAGRRSLLGLPDLVDVLCRLGESELSAYSCYPVTDGEAYSTQRLYAAICAGLEKPVGRVWLPDFAWKLACSVLDLLPANGGESSYEKLFGEELFTNGELCATLNWKPGYTFEDLVGEMVAGSV